MRAGIGAWAMGAWVAALVLGITAGAAAPAAKGRKAAEAEKDKRVWTLGKADDAIALRYILPKGTEPSFAATCQPSGQLMQITVEVSSKLIRSGDGVALSLVNGRRRLELAASAFLAGTDGRLVVEAAVALEPRVFDIFRDGETLTVKVPGATESFPLAGARARLADFERACLPRR